LANGAEQLELGIVSGRVYPQFAQNIADNLDVELVRTNLRDFGNTEQYSRYAESIRNKEVFIFQAHASQRGRPIDVAVTEHRFLTYAARSADAGRINVVFPYAAYSRQDRKAMSGEAIAGAETLREFERAGAHRLLTMDMHSDQLQGVVETPFDHITARYELGDWLYDNWVVNYGRKNVALVAPDAGRAKDVAQVATFLGVRYAMLDKRRDPRNGGVRVERVLGEIAGKNCMLWDDMIDGGSTTRTGAEAIMERGATSVGAIAVHGIFSPKAPKNLNNSPIEQVVVTNSLPQKINKQRIGNLAVVELESLYTEAVRRIHQKQSLSELLKPKREYF
jgi:ribose-phosphate pyrophosphokinase